MARTFSVRRETRRQCIVGMFDDPAGVFVVCADPLESRQDDGRTRVALGFPVLAVTAWTDQAEPLASALAAYLQLTDAAEGNVALGGWESVALAGLGAKLPDGHQWGEDAMECFEFGKRRAVEAILNLVFPPPSAALHDLQRICDALFPAKPTKEA